MMLTIYNLDYLDNLLIDLREQTKYLSSLDDHYQSFQKLLEFGQAQPTFMIPYLIEKLDETGKKMIWPQWYLMMLLGRIVEDRPWPPEAAGRLKIQVKAWKEWYKKEYK